MGNLHRPEPASQLPSQSGLAQASRAAENLEAGFQEVLKGLCTETHRDADLTGGDPVRTRRIIGIVGTLDTKGPEILFVKNLIQRKGHQTIVIDAGVLGEPYFPPDVSREEVARAAGTTIQDIIKLRDEGKAINAMALGVRSVLHELYSKGELHGAICLGGGQAATIGSTALQALPLGVPKVLVSTKVAQAKAGAYAGTRDIVLMPSVADIAGLNRITEKVLSNAAGAIVGMVEAACEKAVVEEKPVAVLTMLGTTTRGCLGVKNYLETKGFEVIVFPTIGVGGKAMEEYLEECGASLVLDLSLNEIGNELFGGMASAGANRLTAAGRKGIPQVIAPGNVEFINFLDAETVPPRYRNRKLHSHNPQATVMRLNGEELREIARVVAQKVSQAMGPVTVIVPLKGFSALSVEGGVFYDPEADKKFIEELEMHLPPNVNVVKVDADFNSSRFVEAVTLASEKF